MKRIRKIIFLILLIFFIFPALVNAATSLDTKNQRPVVGTTFEVSMRIDYGTSVNVGEAHYYINYDPAYLEFQQLNWTQAPGTYTVSNGVITIDKYSTSKEWGYGTPIIFIFKSVGAGPSQILIQEKAQAKQSDGTPLIQSYSGITINGVAPSTDTQVGKLKVEGFKLSPTFNVDKYNYTLTVPSSTSKVKVIATKGEKNQTITGDGNRNLVYGDNRVDVVITAQNGASSTYTIMIHRTDDRSGDVTLKELKVSNTNIRYEEGKTLYEAIVSRSVEKVFLTAKTTDSRASLVGTGERSLQIGDNYFEIKVSSKNDIEKTYTIKITRSEEEIKENVPTTEIESLTIDGTTINLIENQRFYIHSVDNTTDELSVALFTKSTTATYELKDYKNLTTGFNIVRIKVSDDNLEPDEYKIIVYKQPKNSTLVTELNSLTKDDVTNDIYYQTQTPTIISKDVLSLLKNSIDIYYNVINEDKGILYQLVIPKGEYDKDLNPEIKRSTDNPLTYETELPSDIKLTIYVGDLYSDGTTLKVYTYDDIGNYTDLTSGVSVVNGYINITTNGQKYYVFSYQDLIGNKFNITKYIPFIFFGLLVVVALLFLKKKKKNNQEVKTQEPLY